MPTLQQSLVAVLQLLNAGDVLAADAACADLRESTADDPAAQQLLAVVALRCGRPGEARDAAALSLRQRPGHVPTLLVAARAAIALGAPDQAVPLLRRAVQRAESAEAAFLLCHALLAYGDASLEAAIAQAAARHAACVAEWQQLGVALQRAGRAASALAAFSRAAAANPALVAAHFACGLLLREAGRMIEARDALGRAVALDPQASRAWFALGLTHQDLGDEASAADAFAAALAAWTDFAEAAVNLGIARQRLGDMPAAMAGYRRAFAIRPDTLARIAQAVTTASTGMLFLDPAGLRRALGG